MELGGEEEKRNRRWSREKGKGAAASSNVGTGSNREMGSFLGSKYEGDEGSTDAEEEVDVEGEEVVIEKEHMFDKVVTPSDVGKLNRLVIPKQHAEKYFPLDSSTNDKGLLLNFEDRSGKEWRFRYSYWNSSQSYVMTKGWSRFVKDKKLNAGDIVTFHRGKDRLYIDWRRRPDVPPLPPLHYHHPLGVGPYNYPHHPWPHNPLFTRPPAPTLPLMSADRLHLPNPARGCSTSNFYFYGATAAGSYADYVYTTSGTSNSSSTTHFTNVGINPPPSFYITSSPNTALGGLGMRMLQWNQPGGSDGDGGGRGEHMVFESVPLVHGNKVEPATAAAGKRLRLFGVNMDCPDTSIGDPSPVVATTMSPQFAVSATNMVLHSQHQHPLQLSLHNGVPVRSNQKGKSPSSSSSSMSFNLDI